MFSKLLLGYIWDVHVCDLIHLSHKSMDHWNDADVKLISNSELYKWQLGFPIFLSDDDI